MKIIYEDGSILTGSVITVNGGTLYVDDIYEVNTSEVLRIEED